MRPELPLSFESGPSARPLRRIPLAVKVALTLFVAVLVPVYFRSYGPTNFLYFCDVALLLALAGAWLESPLLISMCCVGILLPQAFWLLDFGVQLAGFHLTGLTAYMFRPTIPLYARGLSLFHGWLPLLLMGLVARLGYDRRALPAWGLLATLLVAVSYLFLPPAGAVLLDPNIPVNVDYVYGFSDREPQHWMDPRLYVVAYVAALWLVIFIPTHKALSRLAPAADSQTPNR
jgi:hypothetical protein